MSNKTRKYVWPGALALSLAIVGVLAAFVVLGSNPAVTDAHSGTGGSGNHCADYDGQAAKDAHDGLVDVGILPSGHPKCADDMGSGGGDDGSGGDDGMGAEMDMITSSSTTASAGVKLTLDIASLPMDLRDGSSIVLYLEDDYKVPDSIDPNDVYFIATSAGSRDASLNNGGRVYAVYDVEISDDNHFGGDDDWDIQIFVPDFDTRDVNAAEGFQAPMMGDSLQLVIEKAAGIANPSEAHDSSNAYASGYKASYTVLGPGAGVPDAPTGDAELNNLFVRAKIALSADDHDRGYELTVTGSGFNNGTSAAVHVLHTDGAAPDCGTVISQGSRAGIATVGSDDKVAVTFEVTVPTFMAGTNNYLCMVDGEGRMSIGDVEMFELKDSIRVVPGSANAGDTVNIFAQDFPNRGAGLMSLKIAGQEVLSSNAACEVMDPMGNVVYDNCISVRSDSIASDGSATATFDLPGSISGSALEGTVRLDVMWGSVSEDGKVTITGSSLALSKSEALPNEIITITGDGFGGDYIDASMITIDGVALMIDDDSKHRMDGMDVVDVSNAGQFVASVVLWPDMDGTNPSLIAGTHTIKVTDNAGFTGTAVVSVPEPTLSVTPEVAGPRDVITITGTNWPIDNVDGANPDAVDIEVTDGSRARRYSAFADSAGRFTIEHRVASDVAIPSTNQVRAQMGADIVKIGSFEVPAAIIDVDPASGQPGDHINLSVDGMPVYQQVDRVEIGGRNVLPVGNFNTDSTGSVTVTDVLIPGLDPGTYSVLLDVDDTIAIGSLEVLSEGPIGADTAVADGVAGLGDHLIAVFYYDNVGKSWSFYDPRPEFAELNTLDNLVSGEAYFILVNEDVDDVVLNNRTRSLTCRGGDCWNVVVW